MNRFSTLAGSSLTLALLAGAPHSHAQAAGPQLLPTRDVDVSYQIIQGSVSLPQRIRWIASTRRLRIDPPMPGLFVIVDYDTKQMSMVREPERAVVEMKAPPRFISGVEDKLSGAVREGDDQISGLSCTNWRTSGLDNTPATACITPDGVLLQVKSGGHVVLTADAVRYGPQDPALFQVPADYTRLSTDSLPRLKGP